MPRWLALALTVVVLAVAGCAAGTGKAPPSVPSDPATTDREALAHHDAAERLARFHPPAGAERLAGQPTGAALLDRPADPDAATAATATAWWRVSGAPVAVLRGVATPDGASSGNSFDAGGADDHVWAITFDWPAQGVLAGRTMVVRAARVGTGTVLRVDAVTVWRPARPAGSWVPATARSLVVSYRPSGIGGPGGQPSGPVTVTDPAQIAAIADEVNSLPVEPYRARPCPAPIGDMDLAFGGGPVVRATLGGCDDVTVGPDVVLVGARGLAAFVVSTLHLAWRVPL